MGNPCTFAGMKMIRYATLLIVLLTLVSCNHYNDVDKQLNLADSLMTDKPDSALTVLNKIDIFHLNGREACARYALLKSMALDKNYIDTTTFDVLQPAIDYYLVRGNADEKLRTLYYRGRIYQNQGDDDAAMRSFIEALDLKETAIDTLVLAHTLVAQGALYLKQYKTSEFIHNNMEAAKLYGAIGRSLLEIKSYTKAIDGYVIMNDKAAADSIISICMPLVQKNPDGEAYLFASILSYTIELCSPDDIKAFLDAYQGMELTKDETMNFAQGYSKIGEYDKALHLLSEITPSGFLMDSLKYTLIKTDILEKQGKYEQAMNLYKDYSAMLERYQKDLLSKDLLFSDKKHQLEMKSLMDIQDRDRIIWGTLCGISVLVILIGWLYYRSHISKTKHELETANLKLEIAQLESERNRLKDLQREQAELAKPIQDVIKVRLDMLNGLLAKEITNNDSYAKPYNKWIETIHNDKQKFMDSTRLAFAASHPKLMAYLEQHGLSVDEINYLCLYAIGLRGKEVGEYIQLKRHYVISHEIRKKLGIGEHETNIGQYIRRLMKEL